MARRFALSLIALGSCSAAFCQSDAAKPAFDIADVHLSPRSDWVKTSVNAMQGGYLSGDRYELRRATMLDMIRTAYNVDADKIYGGPAWLDYDRFEVAAKAKPGTPEEALRVMLQTLLAERFGLVAKPDTQPVAGYILSRGKGELKIKAASGAGNVGCQSGTRFSPNDPGAGEARIQCHGVSMQSFAVTLGRSLSGPAGNFPVVDATSLEGTWDIDLQYARPQGEAAPIIAGELSKVGLLLESAKVPQAVLTVEKVNQRPSPNPPGVEAALPPRPLPQFEVASVRLANGQGGVSRALRFEAGGRVTASGMPPGSLIQQAWNLGLFEPIVGLPKSFTGSTAKNITIVAKAPEGWFPGAAGTANGQARDMLNAMLRSLLIDRYEMKFHFEDRPVDTLTLLANKPKLAKADPGNRTGCRREGQQQLGRMLMVKLVCRNMTMAQFAEQMPAYDVSIGYGVREETGLEGAWDFTLNYDAMASLPLRLLPALRASADGAAPEPEDPSGSIAFVDAVQKQLGLKVETHKRPEKVMVIDQMLEEPREN